MDGCRGGRRGAPEVLVVPALPFGVWTGVGKDESEERGCGDLSPRDPRGRPRLGVPPTTRGRRGCSHLPPERALAGRPRIGGKFYIIDRDERPLIPQLLTHDIMFVFLFQQYVLTVPNRFLCSASLRSGEKSLFCIVR